MTQTLTAGQLINVNDGGAVETVIATLPAVSSSPVGNKTPIIRISGMINLGPNALATAAVIRCRQGGIGGPTVSPGSFAVPFPAGTAVISIPYNFFDGSGNSEQAAGLSYVLTMVETAAGAAGLMAINYSVEVLT